MGPGFEGSVRKKRFPQKLKVLLGKGLTENSLNTD